METINSRPLSSFGAILQNGAYAELLKPAEIKEWASNDMPDADGTEYLAPTTPRVKERDVNLTFLIEGKDTSAFLTAYKGFMAEITKGFCSLHVPDLGRTFTLKYESCTSFDFFNKRACKIAVKFTEPVPQNYAL